MYNIHGVQVQNYAQQSADNMADVTLMTVLSIRQPWLNIGAQLKDVRTNKSSAKSLWGGKKKTYQYLQANKHMMYGQMMAVINSSKTDASKSMSLMKIFLRNYFLKYCINKTTVNFLLCFFNLISYNSSFSVSYFPCSMKNKSSSSF